MTEAEILEQAEKTIEISIGQAQGAVKRKAQVQAMFKTKAFKDIIEEGYFKDEAARLVSLLTDPEFTSEDRQEEIRNDMIGISALRQYLLNIHRFGSQMEQQIASSETQLDEMRAELEASEQEGK